MRQKGRCAVVLPPVPQDFEGRGHAAAVLLLMTSTMSRATLIGVHFVDQVQECVLQRLAENLADVRDRILRDHDSFAQDQHVGANFFDDLQHVRTIEDEFALLAERLHQILEDQRRGYVEAGERLVENEDLRIVHDRGDEQNALAHSLGIGSDAGVTAGMQREQFQQGIDLLR